MQENFVFQTRQLSNDSDLEQQFEQNFIKFFKENSVCDNSIGTITR